MTALLFTAALILTMSSALTCIIFLYAYGRTKMTLAKFLAYTYLGGVISNTTLLVTLLNSTPFARPVSLLRVFGVAVSAALTSVYGYKIVRLMPVKFHVPGPVVPGPVSSGPGPGSGSKASD